MATKLLTTEDVADILGVSPRTLEDWRLKGLGPDFVTLSPKVVRYRPAAVDKYVEGHERKTRAKAA